MIEFAERKEFIEKNDNRARENDRRNCRQKLMQPSPSATWKIFIYPTNKSVKPKLLWLGRMAYNHWQICFLQQKDIDIEKEAATFINEKVLTADAALQGARDIIAETVNEDITVREKLRKFFEREALMKSTVVSDKENEAIKYKDYYAFSEKISTIPSHRTLAILRGFLEGFLKISIEPQEEIALEIIEDIYINGMSNCSDHIRIAIKDSYRRLLQPSLETEFRSALKTAADEEAINVFAENLRQLLLSSPLGSKRILAIDPGYRTGCKVVCIDEKGELQKTALIFVHERNRMDEAEHIVRLMVKEYDVQAFCYWRWHSR